MKRIELENKNKDGLTVLLGELRSKLFQLKFDLSERKLKDVSQIGKVKKDIARVLTALKSLV